MHLIKESFHDWNNRDKAIVYINGEVYEDATHAICLQRYYTDHEKNYKVYLGNRPDFEVFNDLSEMNGGQDVILAHRVDKADSIYFIYGLRNGKQMSNNEIKADLKKIYPDKKIYDDMEHDSDDNHEYDEDEQILKGIDRMNEFTTGDLGGAIKLFNYKINNDGQYTNGYATIDIFGEKYFSIRTVPIITIKGKQTNGKDAFSIDDAYSVLGQVEDMCETMINYLNQAGFIMYTDDIDINVNENYVVFLKTIESTKETIEIDVDTKMHLNLDLISRDSQVPFNDAGYETGKILDINDLPIIDNICKKVINFDEGYSDDSDYYDELDFDFVLDDLELEDDLAAFTEISESQIDALFTTVNA